MPKASPPNVTWHCLCHKYTEQGAISPLTLSVLHSADCDWLQRCKWQNSAAGEMKKIAPSKKIALQGVKIVQHRKIAQQRRTSTCWKVRENPKVTPLEKDFLRKSEFPDHCLKNMLTKGRALSCQSSSIWYLTLVKLYIRTTTPSSGSKWWPKKYSTKQSKQLI